MCCKEALGAYLTKITCSKVLLFALICEQFLMDRLNIRSST